jgi:hypothetical protein
VKLRPTLKAGERHQALQAAVDALLLLAAHGNPRAHVWLRHFYLWSHAFDDFLDEPARPRSEVIGLCANLIMVTTHEFYQQHAYSLGPLLGVVAAQYEASLNLDLPITLREGLRLAGNQVILMVALLTGGPELVEEVNAKLWPVVVQSQLED